MLADRRYPHSSTAHLDPSMHPEQSGNMKGNTYSLRSANQLLGVQCRCGHRTVFSPAELVQMSNVAEMESLARLLRMMRCCLCGTKGAVGVALDGIEVAMEWRAGAARSG